MTEAERAFATQAREPKSLMLRSTEERCPPTQNAAATTQAGNLTIPRRTNTKTVRRMHIAQSSASSQSDFPGSAQTIEWSADRKLIRLSQNGSAYRFSYGIPIGKSTTGGSAYPAGIRVSSARVRGIRACLPVLRGRRNLLRGPPNPVSLLGPHRGAMLNSRHAETPAVYASW